MQKAIDREGNVRNRQEALREIERIEMEIDQVEDEAEVVRLRNRWHYLMSMV